MDKSEQTQLDYIKKMLEICENDSERRSIFMAFVTDMSYPRHIICQALKELNINNDMSVGTQ